MSTNKQRRMEEATKLLAKYYGLPDTESVVSALGLDKLTSQKFQEKDVSILPSEIELKLQSILSDTSAGAFLSIDVIKEINKLIGEEEGEVNTAVNELFEIYFDDKTLIKGTTVDEDTEETRTPIKTMMSEEDNPYINDTSNSPSKTSPSVSLMLVNTTRIGMIHKDIHPTVIFLNGIPNVEINRAVPFINVEFYFARPPINEHSGEVQTLSLTRFLEGAQKTQKGDVTRQLMETGQVLGKDVSVSKDKEIQETVFATAGMELFTSPQTMVNANEVYNRDLRSNPVLDQFRPLMSIQDFQASVVPSRGMMSYKSATLNLILHDRSRLSEVADFVRADLYGKNEIKIEYGWNHPDGDILAGVNNPYGDLINGMRVQEKYGVVNSSFSFDDVGQVNIRLELAMRGGTEFDTEIISSDKDGVGNIIKEIEELQKLVGEYRARLTKNTGGLKTKEINGSQILDAAQDALGNLQLTKELQKSLKTFRSRLNRKDTPGDAKDLAKKLNDLFAKEEKKKNGEITSGKTGELRRTIAASIKNKVDKMWKQGDPFLLKKKDRTAGGRNVTRKTTKEQREILGKNFGNLKSIPTGTAVSLARLLLSFVVEPLVNTKKFDDVQMIFYPFNRFAAKACKLNIANFVVDLSYFIQTFYQYRLEHLAKSGVMNINEFLRFVGETLVDDPAASSYGLGQGGKNAWFKNPFENGVAKETAIVMDVADYNAEVEKILHDVTPNASFTMPQVSFYVEALPERQGKEDNEDSELDNGRTILRIHVFDKTASSYDTQAAILASSKDSELSAIGSNPTNNEGGKKGVQKSKAKEASEVLAKADQSGLLVPIKGSDPKLYNIIGGPQEVKKFLMDSLPYIVYGAGGSTIKGANLTSMQNPALNTINLLRSFKKTELQPNGENPGGLPMRIIPTELSLTTLGCPLLNFAQQFFVDFQTGTTADAIYGVVGVTHDFKAGEFTTEMKLTPLATWGKYESPIRKIKNAATVLEDERKKVEKAGNSE